MNGKQDHLMDLRPGGKLLRVLQQLKQQAEKAVRT